MEVLNLTRLFWEWIFPYISRIHTAYLGENLDFRYLKCSVILVMDQDLVSDGFRLTVQIGEKSY